MNSDLQSSTRPRPSPELAKLLLSLKAGQKIRIRQTVRINCRRTWNTADIVGIFRSLNYLATGIATDRVPEDEIVVVAVHFTKENGENVGRHYAGREQPHRGLPVARIFHHRDTETQRGITIGEVDGS